MAFAYVTELSHLGFDGSSSPVLAPQMPVVQEQLIAIAGTSTPGGTFQDQTRFIMINVDTACCLAFGTNPVAVNTAHRIGANETRFYSIRAGDTIAVIASI